MAPSSKKMTSTKYLQGSMVRLIKSLQGCSLTFSMLHTVQVRSILWIKLYFYDEGILKFITSYR